MNDVIGKHGALEDGHTALMLERERDRAVLVAKDAVAQALQAFLKGLGDV